MSETLCVSAEFGLQSFSKHGITVRKCALSVELGSNFRPVTQHNEKQKKKKQEVGADIPSSRPDSQRLTVTTKVFKRSKAGGYSVGGHSGSVGGRVKSRLAPRPPPPTEETFRMTFRRVPEDLERIPDERFIFFQSRSLQRHIHLKQTSGGDEPRYPAHQRTDGSLRATPNTLSMFTALQKTSNKRSNSRRQTHKTDATTTTTLHRSQTRQPGDAAAAPLHVYLWIRSQQAELTLTYPHMGVHWRNYFYV